MSPTNTDHKIISQFMQIEVIPYKVGLNHENATMSGHE